MASLNKTARGSMLTVNHEGHVAYHMDDALKLLTMALTTMFGEPKFYGNNTDELIKLAEKLCSAGKGEFVAKLAVWARTKGNLRSVSHALVAVVAHCCKGEEYVRKAVEAVASQRGDDGTEILASYAALYGKPFPNALRRGVRDALSGMSAFEIAKYQSNSREFKLRDTLRITHPVPRDQEAAEAMSACLSGTLPKPKGWETELSARGNNAQVWNELISERRLGYMALLRNLRNIIVAGANVAPVLKVLSNPTAVHKSRQLPFRFYSAWRELDSAGMCSTRVSRVLDDAMQASCDNVDRLPGRTAILIDTSGSMSATVSARSLVTCRDIAAVLGAIASHISDDAWVCKFDTDASPLSFTGSSILADVRAVPFAGGGTYMAKGFECLMESGFDADRIIVISDNEVNGGRSAWGGQMTTVQRELDLYRKKVGHDVWCHAIDLQGYGTQQFMGHQVNVIAGWSEQLLRFLMLAENGFGDQLNEVMAIEL